MKSKFKLGLVLFLLGFSGVLSTISMEFPLPQEAREILSQSFTSWQIKGLLLINPTIFLILGITIGTLFYDKVNLTLPIIEKWLFGKKLPGLYPLAIIAVGGGLFSGLLITLCTLFFQPYLPIEFLELGEKFRPSAIVRFLYGGFTEEIIVRFGIMTGIVWLSFRISRSLKPMTYWVGIILSAIIFALLHLPLAYLLLETVDLTVLLYIILANSLGGVVFGWLYWRKGLETAILAHMVTHVVLILGHI
ncbi:MAG: CPBP family glutamic-type intramembrane protease [Flavobacteriaceae bacterium]